MNLLKLQKKVSADQYEFSKHAVDQSIIRNISVNEIKEALLTGEVIEEYPDDKYGPSCLIFGTTSDERALHIQCSFPSRKLIKIITAYEPNSDLWINYRYRKNE